MGCETFITSGLVVIGGEISATTTVNIPDIVRSVVKDIGYNNPLFGMDYRSMGVMNVINPQSADIKQWYSKCSCLLTNIYRSG